MAAIIKGFDYDIFISYARKDDQTAQGAVGAKGLVASLHARVLAKFGDGSAVAAVERADWLFGQWAHETPCRIPGVIWRKSELQAFSIVPRTRSNMSASE